MSVMWNDLSYEWGGRGLAICFFSGVFIPVLYSIGLGEIYFSFISLSFLVHIPRLNLIHFFYQYRKQTHLWLNASIFEMCTSECCL